MCGKYSIRKGERTSMQGSPPHVREVLGLNTANKVCDRITPACAGSTRVHLVLVIIIKDHPRMCGKYCFIYNYFLLKLGSPPHVREVFS